MKMIVMEKMVDTEPRFFSLGGEYECVCGIPGTPHRLSCSSRTLNVNSMLTVVPKREGLPLTRELDMPSANPYHLPLKATVKLNA